MKKNDEIGLKNAIADLKYKQMYSLNLFPEKTAVL